MKTIRLFLLLLTFLIISCNNENGTDNPTVPETSQTDFIIAFGSCNIQTRENILWSEVLKNDPNLWIWGGDNIYSSIGDMTKMEQDYQQQLNQSGYDLLRNRIEIIGTWDDHDYGVNDGGKENPKRVESQGLFLDFMGVPVNDPRRNREGIYHSKNYNTSKGSIKVIVLDTRYFRDPIVKLNSVYQPNNNGTILGTQQWQWFQNELNNSTSDFNIIVTSIQFLSSEHRFEKWSNFPNEVIKFKEVLKNSNAKGIIVLSGDRHISEFSKSDIDGLNYPLIDFTSSGLTHSYTNFTGEPNTNRIQNVIFTKSFGLVKFDFDSKKITMQMRGVDNILYQEYIQTYP